MKNSDQLEIIVDKHQDELLRFAFFKLGSMDDAQDVVQNVFIKLFNDKTDIKAINNIRSYLFRSISNSCNDILRSRQLHRFVSAENMQIQNELDYDHEIDREFNRIEKLMRDIAPEQVEVIKMKIINNLSFVEIANILGLPTTTVKSRFKYGIDKLRAKTK